MAEAATDTLSAALAEFARALFRSGPGERRALLLSIMAGALLEGFGLAMLIPLLAVLTGTGIGQATGWLAAGFAFVGAMTRIEQLAVLLTAFVAIVAVRALVLADRDRRLARYQFRFVEDQRRRFLSALAAAGWREISGVRHAAIVQALDDNLERTGTSARLVLLSISSVWMLWVQWLLAWLISPALALFGAILVAAGAILLTPALRRGWRQGGRIAGIRSAAGDQAAQLLGGLKLAMAQDLHHSFIEGLADAGQRVSDRRVAHLQRFGITRIMGSTLVSLVGAAALLIGVWQGISLLALIAGIAILSRMVGPVTAVQQSAQLLTESLPGHVAQARLRETLARAAGEAGPVACPALDGAAITLNGVSYAHPGRNAAGVDGVDLRLAPGEFLGISGPSGAGKTTLLDLVAGLLSPDAGEIRIGAAILDRTTIACWRRRIAYVGQDPYLINDTLRRNLLFGAATDDESAIAAALEIAGATGIVSALPAGLETEVGERGSHLSGGQRQRIVLARAILRRPALLILDEATGAIDSAGEADIFALLRTLSPRPAALVVSHRPEALASCDRIVRLEAGSVVPDAGESSRSL